jgi:isopenicillin-N epimerase
MLCVPAALGCMASLMPDGWPAVMAANRALALRARELLCEALQSKPPAPTEMLGAMAAVIVRGDASEEGADPLPQALRREEGIEVPVFGWGDPPRRVLRISAQLYNADRDFRRLAESLRARYL